MTDVPTLWQLVLTDIEKEVSKANYFTLFKKIELVALDEKTATIHSPSTIVSNLVQNRYGSVLKASLDKHTQKNITMIFVTNTSVPQTEHDKTTPLFAIPKPVQPIIKVGHLPRVRSDYTFDTLAVSQSNQLAFVSGQTVAEHPGASYNPLFIYGPVGVGKTHLMQAIANAVYEKNPEGKIIYITSEEFTNEVVEAIRMNNTANMKRRFRSVQLLIIDDVQFIAGKDRVQEELFHTFNSLIDGGGQIVLSSDRPPSEIKKLEARLSSRFAGGLTVDVEAPDFEMRTAIVLKKAEKFAFALSIDIAKIIAEKEQDVRSLEGTLLRFMTEAQTKKQEMSSSLAEKIMRSDIKPKPAIRADDVIQKLCEVYGIKPTQLKGPKRDASLVKVRQIAMYLLKKELRLPFVEIGNMLGGRDHTTVMHGVEKMETLVGEKPVLQEEILGITKVLWG